MRPTITHIAALAGVSKTTVSFAFNDPSKISRQTYERIMAIADREGYVPDPVARSMTTKRAGAIGVLLPQTIQESFRNPYVTEVLRGVGTVCHQEDLFLTILPPVKGYLSQAVRNAVVDGFIALGIEAAPEIADLIRQRRVPFVTIDGDADARTANVGIDDAAAAEAVMDYVLSRGHEDIVVVALRSEGPVPKEEASSRTVDRRLAGFERALRAHHRNLGDVRILRLEATMEAAAAGLEPLLAVRAPTAVVCMSDSQAFGVYSVLRRAGLSIPEDVSVTGMDDLPFSAQINPGLCTVRQPGLVKGTYAARAIIDLLHGRPTASVVLPADLVIRASVARPGRPLLPEV